MEFIVGILAFIFVLGIIILVHEGGHFIFARRANVLCREFAFGMGPILFKKKKGETLYSIRAFPIGGFCAIAGEEYEDDPLKGLEKVKLEIENNVIKKIYLDTENGPFELPTYRLQQYDIFDADQTNNLYMIVEDEFGTHNYRVDRQAKIVNLKQEAVQIAPYNRTIGSKTKRARAMTMFGGPLMNFLLALLVFFIAGLVTGFPVYESSELNELHESSPAYKAGLREGDVIRSLESGVLFVEVNEWRDISVFMNQYEDQFPTSNIIVKYLRDGNEMHSTIRPQIVINTIGLFSDVDSNEVKVGHVHLQSRAYEAGLRQGHIITEINGNPVSSWKTVYDTFNLNVYGEEVIVKVEGAEQSFTVVPYSKDLITSQITLTGESIPMARMVLGVSPTYAFNLFESIQYSGTMTYSSFGFIVAVLRLLFSSNEVGVGDLSGPIGIATITNDVAKLGFASLLNWIGLLSVNVGLLNLLPIPALDGGRLVFLGYEAVTKKKPSQKVETTLIGITMILLLGLMLYVTFNDILRLIGVR